MIIPTQVLAIISRMINDVYVFGYFMGKRPISTGRAPANPLSPSAQQILDFMTRIQGYSHVYLYLGPK